MCHKIIYFYNERYFSFNVRMSTRNKETKFIDIRNVIHSKSPRLAKWIPRFLVRYLQKTIHEDEINDIMFRFQDLYGLDFVDALIEHLDIKVNLYGVENIPLDESVVFVSNHPLGGLDGIAFMHAIGRYRRDVKFLVNDILMNIKNLEPLFIPVNKLGNQGKNRIKAIDTAYAQDHALLVFPAGLVSRKINNKVVDLEWKKSFVGRAKKYKKNIVPVHIEGENSNFFYNLANIRKKVGLKANIEMLYLPKELFLQKGQTVDITIGKIISHTVFGKERSEQEWAREVREIVYTIVKD